MRHGGVRFTSGVVWPLDGVHEGLAFSFGVSGGSILFDIVCVVIKLLHINVGQVAS
jgi:hypothetical protein